MDVEFVNAQSWRNTSSQSFTANAGTNRVLVVWTFDTSPSVSSVTWNSTNMTKILNTGSDERAAWILPIGTSGTNETATLAVSTSVNVLSALVYENVNQTTPNQDEAIASGTDPTQSSGNITFTGASALITAFGEGANGVSIDNSGYTDRTNPDFGSEDFFEIGDFTASTSPVAVSVSDGAGSGVTRVAGGIALALQANSTFNADPLIVTATLPNPAYTGDANFTADPLVLTGTLPTATFEGQQNTVWTLEEKPSDATWTNEDLI